MDAILKINAFDNAQAGLLNKQIRALVDRRARSLGAGALLSYSKPLHIVRAEGVWLFDPEGNAYLDAYNNVPHVGHCHPRVVEAVRAQMATLNIHTRYLTEIVYDYTEKLLGTFPVPLHTVALTCTGTEANDLAMRVARSATGGTGFIVTRFAYHGNSLAVSTISPSIGRAVPVGPDVRLIDAPDPYRNPNIDLADFMADAVDRAIEDMDQHGIRLAALIADSVFSSDGVFPGSAPFLGKAIERTRAAGGLYIADEVQPGFGRLGSHMWGFERHAVVPDLTTLGKPMANGIPMGALISRADLLDRFIATVGYFNTFGGNPVSCAAGMAVLDILQEEALLSNARDVGRYLKAGLNGLANEFPAIGDVRGAGFFLALEFVTERTGRAPDPDLAARVVDEMRERRVLLSATGRVGNIIKIRPPMPFSRANADQLLATLRDVMTSKM